MCSTKKCRPAYWVPDLLGILGKGPFRRGLIHATVASHCFGHAPILWARHCRSGAESRWIRREREEYKQFLYEENILPNMIEEKDGILLLNDEIPPSMRGFRNSLEQALRSQEWVRHTVDYWRFKKRLKYFARRRCQILRLLRASQDQTLSEQTLIDLLGSAPPSHPSSSTPFHHHSTDDVSSDTCTNAAADPEDVYMNAPLSCNLSMDAHAHIGRSSASSAAADVYVEMKEYPSSRNRSDDSTVDSSSSAKPQKQRSQRSIMRRISISERNEIFAFLEWEMDKSLMFYLSQWQKLSLRLEQVQQQHQSQGSSLTDPLEPQQDCNRRRIMAELSEDILELLVFVLIQIITTQQILIRYDAFALAFEGTPMFQYYMKQVMSGPPSSFRKIQQHEELDALTESYQRLCVAPDPSFTAQWERWGLLLERLPSSDGDRPVQRNAAASTSRNRCCDSCLAFTMQKWLHLALLEDRLSLEPAHFWTSRGQSLVQEMALLAAWRQRKFQAEEEDIPDEKDEDPNTERKLSGLQVFHLTLNLLAAFLYCMNYYVRRSMVFLHFVSSTAVTDALVLSLCYGSTDCGTQQYHVRESPWCARCHVGHPYWHDAFGCLFVIDPLFHVDESLLPTSLHHVLLYVNFG
jgi:SPX domain